MGEAAYSLLAMFPKKITEKQQTAIKAFFLESFKAYEYWQDNRGKKKSQKDFWQEFKTQFPTVSEYVASLGFLDGPASRIGRGGGLSYGNVGLLSGKLDFGNEDYMDQLCFDGREMTYSAEVWHFADWEPLVEFLKTKFGATEANYMSEENAPSGTDLIKLMIDAQQADVVKALLKQDKKFLMTLIGIHPKLDAQIEPLLKGSEKNRST